LVPLPGRGTWVQGVWWGKELRGIFGPKKEKVTRQGPKLFNEGVLYT
jgi:hypothetical protein